jgi:hypothetical protein
MGERYGTGCESAGGGQAETGDVLIKSIVGASHHRALSSFCSPRLVPRSSSRAHIISSPLGYTTQTLLSLVFPQGNQSSQPSIRQQQGRSRLRHSHLSLISSLHPSHTPCLPAVLLQPTWARQGNHRSGLPPDLSHHHSHAASLDSVKPAQASSSSLPPPHPTSVSPTLASSRLASLLDHLHPSSPAPRTTHHTTYTTGLPPPVRLRLSTHAKRTGTQGCPIKLGEPAFARPPRFSCLTTPPCHIPPILSLLSRQRHQERPIENIRRPVVPINLTSRDSDITRPTTFQSLNTQNPDDTLAWLPYLACQKPWLHATQQPAILRPGHQSTD